MFPLLALLLIFLFIPIFFFSLKIGLIILLIAFIAGIIRGFLTPPRPPMPPRPPRP